MVTDPFGPARAVVPWAISAADVPALRRRARQLHAFVREHPGLDTAGVAAALAATAGHERRAVVVGDRDRLLDGLAALAEGTDAAGLVHDVAAGERPEGGLAFVYPGQGGQWPGMAAHLLDTSPAFATRMRECADALAAHVDWSPIDVLRGLPGTPDPSSADVIQPVLLAVMVSLTALWEAHGVVPDAVVGHSMGELAAAYVAGALSLEDATRVSVVWSRAQVKLAGRGEMASIALPAPRMWARLARWDGRIVLAGVNGPTSVVISGDRDAVAAECAALEADGVSTRIIPVGLAAHAPHIDEVLDEVRRGVASVTARAPRIPLYSGHAGGLLTAATDAGYWCGALREIVLFDPAVRALLDDGHRTFVEVGPHPVLTAGVEETAGDHGVDRVFVTGTLRRGAGDLARFYRQAAELSVRGLSVDWRPSYASGRPVDLPAEPAPLDDDGGEGPDRRLPGLPAAERHAALLALVREEAAIVSGRAGTGDLDDQRPIRELGFDSAAAIELRNRLRTATGLPLPTSLVFDHPTLAGLAAHLSGEVAGGHAVADEHESHAADDDPLVIVGMACRYPGGADSPEDLWRLVDEGIDAIGTFPADRGWDLDGLYNPDPERPGTTYTASGGFRYDAAEFDAEFFGIPPREALAMDPQQRLLLEVAWEALERAGIDPATLRGTRTGVFAGVMAQEYGPRMHEGAGGVEGYLLTGGTVSVASGRIAYTLGLEGPAVSVDTACSSSLVALHTAAQALRRGECSLALVGGVAVMATPGLFVEFSRLRGLAPDGRCKSFAAAADGTGWGEGVGMLVLERLSDARRAGHPVLAVIRGSAVNQDGASNGLSAPSGAAQQRLIRRALATSGLRAGDVDVLEAHGTGTTLGDPIEAEAVLATYGQNRDGAGPLLLGSVKSNIGHTQAAAGMAGVIKMVLALRHERVPRTLHVDEPSPHVDWDSGAVTLVREPVPWPRGERVRRAGVSSFGISGTNAHLILEEAPAEQPAEPAGETPPVLPWVLTARSEPALRAYAERLAGSVSAADPADVGFSLATTRSMLAHRAVVVGTGRAGLLRGLDAVATGAEAPYVVRGEAADPGRVAFVFPGQGSQWAGMAAGLLAESPLFRERLAECDAALAPHTGWSLEAVVRGGADAPDLDRVDVVQPALFGVMVALAGLWQSMGVRPDAVVGHSQGEIAAACVAGILSLEDAARVVALRARALRELAGSGAMASVLAPADRVAAMLAPGGKVAIAAVNGPASTVVSGPPDAVAALVAACEAAGLRARPIPVDYASHCAQVDPLRESLLAALGDVTPGPGTADLYSSVTGERLDAAELDAAYWFRNLREPVRFEDATRALLADGYGAFVECAPHPVLSSAVAETAEDRPGRAPLVVGSLRRDEGGLERFLASAAEAFAGGVAVDWSFGTGRRRVGLPTYPFQRRHYWLAPPATALDATGLGLGHAEHPLLGAAVELADGTGLLFTAELSRDRQPWLADHTVLGTAIVPGAAFVDLFAWAGGRLGCPHVAELVTLAPLVLPEEGAVTLQLRVRETDGGATAGVYARGTAGWNHHATATLAPAGPVPAMTSPAMTPPAWPPAGAEPVDLAGVYDRLADAGYAYGPAFRGLRAAWRLGAEVFAEVALPGESGVSGHAVHPALLDAALHPVVLGLLGDVPVGSVPFSWTGVSVGPGTAGALRVRLTPGENGAVTVAACDAAGTPVVSVAALVCRPIDPERLGAARVAAGGGGLLHVEWSPAPPGPVERDLALVGEGRLEAARHPDLAALVAAIDAGAPVPAAVVVPAPYGEDGPAAAHAGVRWLLELRRRWFAEERLAASRLVVVTRGAVAAAEGETPSPAAAALCGLIRVAAAEHPGRFLLADLDDAEESWEALRSASACGEPQLAIRGGKVLRPRLVRAATGETAPAAVGGTVLVTGGTGALGAEIAAHLVQRYGVRHLLLVSRQGPDAEGAGKLTTRIAELGGEATVLACDTTDRAALARALAQVPEEHPLTGVVHAAGVLDDGTLDALTPGRFAEVMRVKADGAWHLHELTRENDLAMFVLFSSAAGLLGNPGQANYAAGCAFADALAEHRRARGLPATSIAWGLWETPTGLTARLGGTDLARMRRRLGLAAMASADGLALFDAAIGSDHAVSMAARLDQTALRTSTDLPAILSGLAPAHGGPEPVAPPDLAERLAAMALDEAEDALRDLVCAHAATVLGHARPQAVDPDRSFSELGFDSLTAVELRNRLSAATGTRLSATLAFDHPTAAVLAVHLRDRLVTERDAATPILEELDRLSDTLSSAGVDDDGRAAIAERLTRLLRDLGGEGADGGAAGALHDASDDEVFDFIGREFGIS